ncbi:enoyl-CoA hydratase/isomerase family protein [Candidatus Palauibacter sp.]|uniref:enoyl-CoA hydratase/isomerase family protein n=1 Tax=Candidatus Palauibacter sp. TaxID=3101350 RepID=UPI003C702C34
MFEYLDIDIDERTGVNRIHLDRPARRNALNGALVAELKEALALADADERVRVIGLGGHGRDFCAGADLAEVQASVEEGVLASLREAEALGELFTLLRKLSKPVVAVVHGRALAGGCGLATACDLVLAAESARFGYPEVRLGFVPAMVTAILRRNVGERRAFELMALGDTIDAREAARLGLVNRVYADAEFETETSAFLTELASRSASALALTKRLLYGADAQSFEAAIAAGARVNALARMTDDCQAGIRKFLSRGKKQDDKKQDEGKTA